LQHQEFQFLAYGEDIKGHARMSSFWFLMFTS